MKADCLTTELLDNCLSLQLMPPNIRRHGVLETRISDSVQTTPEIILQATEYFKAAYDDKTRKKFNMLADQICPDLLEKAYQNRFTLSPSERLATKLGPSFTLSDLHNALKSPSLRPCKKTQRKM
jgi:hypothetical protein